MSALVVATLPACSRADESGPAVATPSLTLTSPSAAIGTPMEMTYQFVVADSAPAFTEDYWVFVHFLDTDDELMWTDDHVPATPTTQWRAGTTVTYPRTMFVPKFPYVGETRIEVGLFSPKNGTRLPLTGDTRGQRSYRVAAFDLRLPSDVLFVVFKDGWHETEIASEAAGREWQWSKKEGTLSFRNPQRAVRFYLQVDQPAAAAFTEPQRVEVRLGSTVVDTFDVRPGGGEVIRRIELSPEQLGSAETVEMTLTTDKTFVPAAVPALQSNDSRKLGIRVFRAFVEPKTGDSGQ